MKCGHVFPTNKTQRIWNHVKECFTIQARDEYPNDLLTNYTIRTTGNVAVCTTKNKNDNSTTKLNYRMIEMTEDFPNHDSTRCDLEESQLKNIHTDEMNEEKECDVTEEDTTTNDIIFDDKITAGLVGHQKQKQYVKFITNLFGSEVLTNADTLKATTETVTKPNREVQHKWPMLSDETFMTKLFFAMQVDVFGGSSPATPQQTRDIWQITADTGDKARQGSIKKVGKQAFNKYVKIFLDFINFFIKSHIPRAIEIWNTIEPKANETTKYRLFIYEIVRTMLEGPLYTNTQHLRDTTTKINLKSVEGEYSAIMGDIIATFVRYNKVKCFKNNDGELESITLPNPDNCSKLSLGILHTTRIVLMSMQKKKHFKGKTTETIQRLSKSRMFTELASWKARMTVESNTCEGTKISVTPHFQHDDKNNVYNAIVKGSRLCLKEVGAMHRRLMNSTTNQMRTIFRDLLKSSKWLKEHDADLETTINLIMECFQAPVSTDTITNHKGRMVSKQMENIIKDNRLQGFIKECLESETRTDTERTRTNNCILNTTTQQMVNQYKTTKFDNVLLLHTELKLCLTRLLTSAWISTSFMSRPVDWKDLSDTSLMFDEATGKVMVNLTSSKHGGSDHNQVAGGKLGVLHSIDKDVAYMTCGWLRFFGAPSKKVFDKMNLDKSMSTELQKSGMNFECNSSNVRQLSLVIQSAIFYEETKNGKTTPELPTLQQLEWGAKGTSTSHNNNN
jgi:hypothetical protein